MHKITIEGNLPAMNEMIDEAKKTNRKYCPYNDMKRDNTDLVMLYAKTQLNGVTFKKVDVKITWYCKDKRKDKDNIMSGQKFIFDGLVRAGTIKNDGWANVGDITHGFEVDKENPRIEIEIKENTKGKRLHKRCKGCGKGFYTKDEKKMHCSMSCANKRKKTGR